MQKRNGLCRFDKVMLSSNCFLKRFFFGKKMQRRLLVMNRVDFENGPSL